MPKELFEITMFNAGTICNPAQTDIPSEAASNSLNLDPIAEDGKLKGIPENTKIEDTVGHEKNILLQETIDPTEHDLISYKNAGNVVYAAEDIYSGSATEASLGVLTNATDTDIAMEAMEGAVYLGQGISDNATPQWIGRLDHGQWTEDAPDTLVMQEDTLLPPNMTNESTSACSDGSYIYMVNAGGHGNPPNQGSATTSLKSASGEITKIRISDGKVIARSSAVLGYTNAICVDWGKSSIWVVTSEKWALSDNTATTISNTHVIYNLNISDLSVNRIITDNNLHNLVTAARPGYEYWNTTGMAVGDDDGANWEDEDSYWEGASLYDYQGHFSDILDLNGTLWVCTSAGAVFNCFDATGDTFTFTDRTPMGLGYFFNTIANTEEYMPPGGIVNQTGGWYNNGATAWNFPACFNGSLMQLTGSNDYVGLYVRNGQETAMKFDSGGSNIQVETKGMIIAVPEGTATSAFIDGSTMRLYPVNDTPGGTREIGNMMYKCPKDIYKSAYNHVTTWGTTAIECNIREFDNPAFNATHGDLSAQIATTEVETYDTSQIPIRISDTLIVGLISDVILSNHQQDSTGTESSAILNRNKWRKMSKWAGTGSMASASDWAHTSFGDELYLSNRCSMESQISQTDNVSSFHVANVGYFYRFSFMYDGFQESPLGAAMHIWSNGYKINFKFSFSTDNFPTRVTGLRIYRATSISAADRNIGGFYHFVGEVDITTQEVQRLVVGSYPNGHIEAVCESDEIETSPTRIVAFTDSGASGATYETMSGLFEAMTDSNIKYSLSTQLNSSLFVAKCQHHSQDVATHMVYKSLPYKPSLMNWALDFLKLPEVPTAIQSFNGRIYAFTANATYRIEPNNLFIEDIFTGAGCIGPDAIYSSDYGMCYCDNNNIYLNTGQIPIPIGDSILTSDAGIGYLDLLNVGSFSPKIGFDSTRKSFIVFVTATRAWAYNVIRKVWNLWEVPTVSGITSGKSGEILAAVSTDADLYDLFSSDTRKSWNWTSKKLSMRHKTQNKRWYEQIVAYEGTVPTVSVYWDEAGTLGSIASGTDEANIVRKQLGNTETAVNHRLIQTKIEGSANTEVDSVGFTFRRFAKLIDQGAP
tara:strand:- start:2516 stop:5815 length:3300 start_codon:yes stop_codon:yes gene_type:complete